MHLHNPASTAFDVVDDVFVGGKAFVLTGARIVKGAALIRLDGIASRDDAEAICGKPVEVLRDQLELDEEDVLLEDLVGCRLELASGDSWGEVAEVIAGSQDRLVIHDGDMERELPLVDAFVLSIDLEAGVIVVAPPPELPEWERNG